MQSNLFQSIRYDYRIYKLNKKYKAYNVEIRTPLVDDNVRLGKCVRIENLATIVQDVSISDYSFIGINSFVGSARIGKFCSIGRNVTIGGYEHPAFTNISSSPMLYRTVLKQSERYRDIPPLTFIENDVWIGNNALIKGGVHIGNGAVIGMGTVVTKDVPDFAVVVGNPGRVLKYRFLEEKIEKILSDPWWDKSEIAINSFFEGEQL